MPITRRSLLQTLGALPATWFARGLPAIGQSRAAKTPPPESAFVLLEGPWLIFPKVEDSQTLTALTVGYSLDKPLAFRHECVFQHWKNNATVGIETALDPDISWEINANSPKADFGTVLDQAFTNRPFVWANDASANTQAGDRSVTVQVPTKIYIDGLQKHGQVKGGNLYNSSKSQPVTPHIVTIMQFDPPASGKVRLYLNLNGSLQQTLGPGDHLIIRMRHLPGSDDDLQHIRDSFAHIQNRLETGNSMQFTIDTDSDYYSGDSPGISDEEMGLKHPTPLHQSGAHVEPNLLAAEYSNCCGGTIVSGGGGPS